MCGSIRDVTSDFLSRLEVDPKGWTVLGLKQGGIHRPLPSIDIFTPASLSIWVNATLVN